MGLAGAGVGATRSLEEIVAERILQQKLQQEIDERQQRFGMDQARLNETMRQNDYDRKRTDRIDAENTAARTAKADEAATAKRGRSNMAGVIGMGLDPATAKREIAFSALNSGADVPDGLMDAITPPKVERDPIADYEARKKLDRKYERPAVLKPERDPIADYEAKKKIDQKYGTANPNGSNPQEAAKTAAEASRVAGELLKHPGFGGAFGVVDSLMPTVRQDTADAESLRDALTSLLTLENMGKMKGVLSDSDMKIIRQASTSLNARMGDKAARSEVSRIKQVMDRVGGGMPAMNLETSHGATTGAADPVDALIAKYGKKP